MLIKTMVYQASTFYYLCYRLSCFFCYFFKSFFAKWLLQKCTLFAILTFYFTYIHKSA